MTFNWFRRSEAPLVVEIRTGLIPVRYANGRRRYWSIRDSKDRARFDDEAKEVRALVCQAHPLYKIAIREAAQRRRSQRIAKMVALAAPLGGKK